MYAVGCNVFLYKSFVLKYLQCVFEVVIEEGQYVEFHGAGFPEEGAFVVALCPECCENEHDVSAWVFGFEVLESLVPEEVGFDCADAGHVLRL